MILFLPPANLFHNFFEKKKSSTCYSLDAMLGAGGIKVNRTDRNLARVCVHTCICVSDITVCIVLFFIAVLHVYLILGNWDVYFHLIDLQRILVLGCSRSKSQLLDKACSVIGPLLFRHTWCWLVKFHKEEGSEMPNSLKFSIGILAAVLLELFGNKCKTIFIVAQKPHFGHKNMVLGLSSVNGFSFNCCFL